MTDTPLTPALGSAPATHPATRHFIYRQCRESAAIAAGLSSMASRVLADGGASPHQLEHLADLSDHLLDRLEELAAAFADASTDDSPRRHAP